MSIKVEYPTGTDITSNVRVGGLTNIVTAADRGLVGQGTLYVDDLTAALTLNPLANIKISETQCTNPVTFVGYSGVRAVTRITNENELGTSRRWNVTVLDPNVILGSAAFEQASANRPAETDIARVTWLLGTSQIVPVSNTGFVASSGGVNMSAADYRGQFPIDILADCGSTSGRNYFAFYDPTAGRVGLFYAANTDAVFTSTLLISNVAGDADNVTVFAPSRDATLTKDPSNVYTEVIEPYTGGYVDVTTTGTTDLQRTTFAPELSTTDRTVATARATQYLTQFATEQDTITCRILLPIDKLNLLLAGMRVQVKFSHLAGYTSYTFVRVTRRSVMQDPAAPNVYTLELELANPVTARYINSNYPNNTQNPPGNTAPFVSATGSAFTFVQSAKTVDGTDGVTATFGSNPTVGNFLVAIVMSEQGLGGVDPSSYLCTFPSGWITDVGPVGVAADGRLIAQWIGHKVSVGAGDKTVTPVITLPPSVTPGKGFIVIAEYTGGGVVSDFNGGVYTNATAVNPYPTLTPTSGSPALIVQCVAHEPDYTSSPSVGWTQRQEYRTLAASRQALAYVDQIIATASGSYTGAQTSAGGTDGAFFIPGVAYTAQTAASPGPSQPVTDTAFTYTGSGQIVFTTVYPYAPKSLVLRVNGIIQSVTETNAATGSYTIGFVPENGDIIQVTYQGAL